MMNMPSKKFTSRETRFEAVMGRLKQAIQVENDSQLAEELGLSSSGFANLKKRGSLPYERFERVCNSRNVSMDWLLTGEGAMWRGEPTDRQMLALMGLVSALSPEQRRDICAVVEEKKRLNELEKAVFDLRAAVKRG